MACNRDIFTFTLLYTLIIYYTFCRPSGRYQACDSLLVALLTLYVGPVFTMGIVCTVGLVYWGATIATIATMNLLVKKCTHWPT
jgi:hypothetical protein